MTNQFSLDDIAVKLGIQNLPDAEKQTLLDDVMTSLIDGVFIRLAKELPDEDMTKLQATLDTKPDVETLMTTLQQYPQFQPAFEAEAEQLTQDLATARR